MWYTLQGSDHGLNIASSGNGEQMSFALHIIHSSVRNPLILSLPARQRSGCSCLQAKRPTGSASRHSQICVQGWMWGKALGVGGRLPSPTQGHGWLKSISLGLRLEQTRGLWSGIRVSERVLQGAFPLLQYSIFCSLTSFLPERSAQCCPDFTGSASAT